MPQQHHGRRVPVTVAIELAALMTGGVFFFKNPDQRESFRQRRARPRGWLCTGERLRARGGELPRTGNVKLLRKESQAWAQTQNVRPNLNCPKFGSGCEICGLGPFLVYI